MDRLLELLQTHKWVKSRLRYNIVPPEDRVVQEYNGRKGTYLRKGIKSQSLASGQLFDHIMSMAPERPEGNWLVTINENIQCYPHKDRGNVGHSYILFLGDFSGGELCFEDGTIVSEPRCWHEIDGSLTHWNEPITSGIKYSVILFNKAPTCRYGIRNT